jgi:hypothetical protein
MGSFNCIKIRSKKLFEKLWLKKEKAQLLGAELW